MKTAAAKSAGDVLAVVGGGLAGAKAAHGARQAGFDGRIVVIGEEDHLPYERPPLSKAVLRGEADPATTLVGPAVSYTDAGIELWTGRSVLGLDVGERRLRLDDGQRLGVAAVVLATGSEPRRLDVPGAELDGVHSLRTVDDSIRLRDAIGDADRIAVIGAGWIGSEVAASARQMGVEVVLIDPASTPLQKVVGHRIGDAFAVLHEQHGVKLQLATRTTELQGRSTVERVVLANGDVEEVDLAVVGIGVTPRTALAEASGLVVDDGVVVDDHLRTSAPHVYAAGDVARAWNPHLGVHLRVEHWANALHQGPVAGANAAGADEVYDRIPYFYSDQYDLGLEYVGHHRTGDEVVIRGELEDQRYVAFWHRGGVVTAAMAVNVWDVVDDLRRLVLDPEPAPISRLADERAPLPMGGS